MDIVQGMKKRALWTTVSHPHSVCIRLLVYESYRRSPVNSNLGKEWGEGFRLR